VEVEEECVEGSLAVVAVASEVEAPEVEFVAAAVLGGVAADLWVAVMVLE